MKTTRRWWAQGLLWAMLGVGSLSLAWAAEQSEVDEWATRLKAQYFKEAKVTEDKTVITMETPYRAEDAALTPLSIHAEIPQAADRYIKTLYLFVDKNPQPLAAIFHLTPAMGKADLAMRVRINQYTNVRAIAVLNTGEHHMVVNFVKAQGGCSAPLGADLDRAMARIGQMKFRTMEGGTGPVEAVLQVSHPNITGLQKDQRTRTIHPPHYVKALQISHNGKALLGAELGIAISEDPSFRFFVKTGNKGGKMEAAVVDSKDMKWTQIFDLKP